MKKLNESQKYQLVNQLHKQAHDTHESLLGKELHEMGYNIKETEILSKKIIDFYNNGVGILNRNQFNNIKELASNNTTPSEIIIKLNFYEIEEQFLENILKFCNYYNVSQISINVNELDKYFYGVQVATRDDFNTIIKKGYTGDWVINPNNINLKRFK